MSAKGLRFCNWFSIAYSTLRSEKVFGRCAALRFWYAGGRWARQSVCQRTVTESAEPWFVSTNHRASRLDRFQVVFSNLQKITCIILRNLFGLDLFSHQSCATGTLLLQKKIYPRKYSLNLKQLIIFMFLKQFKTASKGIIRKECQSFTNHGHDKTPPTVFNPLSLWLTLSLNMGVSHTLWPPSISRAILACLWFA